VKTVEGPGFVVCGGLSSSHQMRFGCR